VTPVEERERIRIFAVVLAAGSSVRMARPKLFLEYHTSTLLAHCVREALSTRACRTVVVLGSEHERARDGLSAGGLDRANLEIVNNTQHLTGLASSVRAGVERCLGRAHAAVFCLADQPLVTRSTMDAIMDTYRGDPSGRRIVAPVHGGRRGNPVLFDQSLFPDLIALQGDSGGRSVLERYKHEVFFVECGPEVLFDVDTPEEYALLQTGKRGSSGA
jgi:molybdenum cofactor cytidylyltransferase